MQCNSSSRLSQTTFCTNPHESINLQTKMKQKQMKARWEKMGVVLSHHQLKVTAWSKWKESFQEVSSRVLEA